jgi:hypothetical protein
MELECFGDTPPETKVGLTMERIPRSLKDLAVMSHPDDVQPYLEAVERCVASGEPFSMSDRTYGTQ